MTGRYEKAAPGDCGAESGGENGCWQAPEIPPKDNITPTKRQQGEIESLLPRGMENAVPAKTLAMWAGCRSIRQLQKLIEAERAQGAMILSASTGGYFRPASGPAGRAEIMAYDQTLRARALNTLKALKVVRRAMAELDGQQQIGG